MNNNRLNIKISVINRMKDVYKLENIDKLEIIKNIKINIIINQSKILILLCFYLNIIILLRLNIY